MKNILKKLKSMKLLFITISFLFTNAVFGQDVYQINWTLQKISYNSAIIIYDNGYGIGRVKFYSEGELKIIEETFKVEQETKGINIYGSNPVYPGSKVKFPNYSADAFLLSFNDKGSIFCVLMDGNLSMAICSAQKVIGKSDQNIFLKQFDWKL